MDLVSSYSPTDIRYIEALYSSVWLTVSGCGTSIGLRYLHRFADTDDGRVQRQLKQSIGKPLAAPLTRSRLHHHSEQLFQRWQLITGNETNDPARLASLVEYWGELQAALPTAPVATAAELMLASWLAGQTAVPKGTALKVRASCQLWKVESRTVWSSTLLKRMLQTSTCDLECTRMLVRQWSSHAWSLTSKTMCYSTKQLSFS